MSSVQITTKKNTKKLNFAGRFVDLNPENGTFNSEISTVPVKLLLKLTKHNII